MTKKLIAVLAALVMLLSVVSISVYAAVPANVTVELKLSKDAYKDDVFEVEVHVGTTETTMRAAEITFAYDAAKIQPVKKDGTTAVTKASELVVTTNEKYVVDEANTFVQGGRSWSAGSINYAAVADFQNGVTDVPAPLETEALFSFKFKALEVGATGLAVTNFIYQAVEGGDDAQKANATVTDKTGTIKISAMPVAPVASDLTLTIADEATYAVPNGKLVAGYSFNNGNTDPEVLDKTTGDVSVITWYADGAVIKGATTKELPITKDLVEKKISFDVLAKADRSVEPNVAASAVALADESAIFVYPAEDYKPVPVIPEGEEIKKITAGKEVEAVVEVNDYKAGEYTFAYQWYVADDAKGTNEKAIEGATTATYKFDKENIGKFGYVKVTATYTVEGHPAYVGDAKAFDAVEIKKASTSAPSISTGANLTDKPVEDDKKEDPKEDPKEDNKPVVEDPTKGDIAGEASDKGIEKFKDVDKVAYAWAADSIDKLTKAGVIKGMSDDSFAPEGKTTIAQLVALASRVLKVEGDAKDVVGTDAKHWAAAEIAAAEKLGALKFLGEKFDADRDITREEVATVFYNMGKEIGLFEKMTQGEEITFTDAASISDYAKEAVSALTKVGILNGMGDGTFAPGAPVTRAQVAKIVGLFYDAVNAM